MAQSFAGSSNTVVNDKIALLARLLGSEQQACRLLGDYGGSLSALVLKAAANTAAYSNPALARVSCLALMAQKIAVSQSTSGDMPDCGLDVLNQSGDSIEVALAKQLLA